MGVTKRKTPPKSLAHGTLELGELLRCYYPPYSLKGVTLYKALKTL